MSIEELFWYESVKLVTITNWKFGLLYRAVQFLVIVYIAVYAIWFNTGYQKNSDISGVLFTKVKGMSRGTDGRIYDSGDLTYAEQSALFVATRALHTVQNSDGICVDDSDNSNVCKSNADCVVGNTTNNGFTLANCSTQFGYCYVNGWCPVENETLPFTEFSLIQNWTIFMRTNVIYSEFGIPANNANRTERGYNIFSISEMLTNITASNQSIWNSISNKGAIIKVSIDWSCNLDFGPERCDAKYLYTRVDSADATSSGYNFRRVFYYNVTPTSPAYNFNNINNNNIMETDPNLFSDRILSKFYGILFVFQISGVGKKFDVFSTVITVGSAVAFFSIAQIVVDVVLQYIHPKRDLFDRAKRSPVRLDSDDESSEVNNNDNPYNSMR